MNPSPRGIRPLERPIALTVALLALPVVVLAFLPFDLPDFDPVYAPIHAVFEVASVSVAVVVFAVGWYSFQQRAPFPILLISVCFLGVAVLDLGHLLSINGMPDFITPSGEEKTLRFWMAARLLAALSLAAAAFMPKSSWSPSPTSRWITVAAVMLLTALIFHWVLSSPQLLPRLYRPGEGLTGLKIGLEYLVVALHLVTAVALWWRQDDFPGLDLRSLILALITMAMAEIVFTLYASVSDGFALIGHVYKVVAYGFLFHGLAHSGIRQPYRELAGIRRKLESTLQALPDIVFELDRDGVVHQVHSDYPDLLARPEELIGQPLRQFLPPEVADVLDRLLEDVAANGRSRIHTYTLDIAGETRTFEASARTLDGCEEHPRFIAIVHDATERRTLDHELRIAAAAFESQESMCVTDARHRILRVNTAFERVTGFSADEAIGRQPVELLAGGERETVKALIEQGLDKEDQWRGEVTLQLRDGQLKSHLLLVTAVRDPGGSISGHVYDYIDISALKKAEDRLQQLASFDPLTGLGNRRLLEHGLETTLAECRSSGGFAVLMFINLIGFKKINDAMGFDAGDRLLIAVARELQKLASSEVTACRQGADEFALLAGGLGEKLQPAIHRASTLADRVFAALDRAFVIDGQSYYNRCRIGCTLFSGSDDSPGDVLGQAGIALHQVKHLPDRNFSFFDSRMQDAAALEQSLENDLRRGIREEQFDLFYQPKVDTEARIVGAEALIRWHHPERGLLAPIEFIPIAEQGGLIAPIEKWTIGEAVRQLHRWAADPATRDWSLSINIASSQLYREDFESHLRAELDASTIDNSRLVIELTERTLLHDVRLAREKIQRLADLGVQFSIDDFGTGYSSLAYLGSLPVHELKIDRSFVRDLDKERFNADIIRMVIEMAQILGLRVVAEGVETEDQMQYLILQGCGLLQGFLFGRPMPIDELLALSRRPA